MELRVYRLFVTCYLTCILCRNVVSGSTLAEVFPSINNASQPDTKLSETGNTRAEQSIERETKPDGITLKDDWPKSETSRESLVQDLSVKTKVSNHFEKCSRYCIQQLGIGKGFEDINLDLSFTGQNGDDHFLLENNPNLKILRHFIHNENSTILDYCKIYLSLDCDIINMGRNLILKNDEFYSNLKFNQQNVKILKNYFSNNPELSKQLVHKTNLSGYTEANFQTDTNVTGIAINILGNLTRAVLTIPTNRTVQGPGVVMSLVSTYNTKRVAIGARNLTGRWCVKLTGVENLKYNFDVIAYYGTNKKNNAHLTEDIIDNINSISEIKRKNFDEALDDKHITQNKASIIEKTQKNTANNTANSLLINSTTRGKRKFVFERSVEIMAPGRNNDEIMTHDFSDVSFFSREPAATIDKNIMNHFVLRNNSLSYGEFKILPNVSNTKIFNGKMTQQQKIQARSSEVASLNEDIDEKMKSSISEIASVQSDQSQQFSTQINEDPFERKKILLDVNPNSKLIAASGTTHRIIFDATNNCVLPVRYAIQARSSPFRIYNIQPLYMWLYPGQTDQIAVDIIIPTGSQETVNTLTVLIAGTQISEKTVNVLVQNAFSKNIDNVRPTIEYSFNSNCAGKLDRNRCEKTLWSADITVQDYDSGLKRVIAIPNGLYPRTKYISGTKDRVTFYYWSTCCTPSATITAIDIMENSYTRTIDVTQWDNLSQGEIAAIVLGALFLLILLILLVVAIVYCFRKRNSHDLPYTQRYGSRQPPARAERTSF